MKISAKRPPCDKFGGLFKPSKKMKNKFAGTELFVSGMESSEKILRNRCGK